MLLAPVLLSLAFLQAPQDPTLAPPSAVLLATYDGRGVQIYTCSAGPGSTYAWAFKAPEAKLFDPATGRELGQHGAGPTWTLQDGSAIRGTVLQKRPGETPADVPWLLLRAEQTGNATGALSHVGLVRRSSTRGGNPP